MVIKKHGLLSIVGLFPESNIRLCLEDNDLITVTLYTGSTDDTHIT